MMAEAELLDILSALHVEQPRLVAAPDLSLAGLKITSVTQDSREVGAGSLFCAIRGIVADGHDWIGAAVDAGAVAVLAEEVRTDAVPTIVTADARAATGHVAAEFHGRPSAELDLLGVTGTNGKTTIVTLAEHVATTLGRTAISLGTLTGSLTTVAAPAFQRQLREAVDAGVDLVAAEVSSHALDQRRVDGSRFRMAIFTNLTQDHLDYHHDMEEYFAAKARLFTPELTDVGIVDVATDFGRRMADHAAIPVRTVDSDAVNVLDLAAGTSRFVVDGRTITLPLGGRFNIANALLVVEAFRELGETLPDLADALASVPQIPGRFEWVAGDQPFGVVVDYSHTPASLAAAIASVRELAAGRVIVVFGSGGDRDPSKRPLMGEAATAADIVYVTSDNPRTEDPETIMGAIVDGLEHDEVHREVDREQAIRTAIGSATDGDVVLIAGKGHEDYQVIGTTTRPFDDRVVARASLTACGWEPAP